MRKLYIATTAAIIWFSIGAFMIISMCGCTYPKQKSHLLLKSSNQGRTIMAQDLTTQAIEYFPVERLAGEGQRITGECR